jgi:hypothetical protein
MGSPESHECGTFDKSRSELEICIQGKPGLSACQRSRQLLCPLAVADEPHAFIWAEATLLALTSRETQYTIVFVNLPLEISGTSMVASPDASPKKP